MIRRPAKWTDLTAGSAYHSCGGHVRRSGYHAPEYQCADCSQGWSGPTINGMTAAEIAERFFVPIDPSAETWVLIYDIEPLTKRRFTRLVPAAEAHGKERARF